MDWKSPQGFDTRGCENVKAQRGRLAAQILRLFPKATTGRREGGLQYWTVLCAATFALAMGTETSALGSEVASRSIGPWSSAATWDGGAVPKAGDRVIISPGTNVVYDVQSDEALSSLEVRGTLSFSREVGTQLDVGLLSVPSGGVLEVGTASAPIPDGITATIRFADLGQTDRMAPGLLGQGGRVEIHGAPRQRTWSRLTTDALAGTNVLSLDDEVNDWRVGIGSS